MAIQGSCTANLKRAQDLTQDFVVSLANGIISKNKVAYDLIYDIVAASAINRFLDGKYEAYQADPADNSKNAYDDTITAKELKAYLSKSSYYEYGKKRPTKRSFYESGVDITTLNEYGRLKNLLRKIGDAEVLLKITFDPVLQKRILVQPCKEETFRKQYSSQ